VRIPLFSALLVFAGTVGAAAQTGPVLHADVIIPDPVPTAPLADWTNAAGRATMTLDAGGVTLRGWKYAGSDPREPTVVFFNGNGMTLDRSDALYRSIAAQGPTVVAFDYRGYGFSAGVPAVAAFQADAVRIVDAVAGPNKSTPVVAYGFSLGTAMATYAAAQRPLAGLILAAPFPTARDEFPVFARLNGLPPQVAATITIAPDAIAAFDEAGFVARSRAPLLVLHGTADEDVPIAFGRAVFASSAARLKRFVELPGMHHNEATTAPAALDAVRTFTSSLRP
jgi:pimeloyl-ACP methyl ester carboxylesterase